ncbi:uncharacterized protein METZ01_LOCUS74077 [marine metagenome]|uniref:Uncharacterized protein n=1 Tax=marine metagenome TaxID=408172 RepID=A0A381U439_9ZZZZ
MHIEILERKILLLMLFKIFGANIL